MAKGGSVSFIDTVAQISSRIATDSPSISIDSATWTFSYSVSPPLPLYNLRFS